MGCGISAPKKKPPHKQIEKKRKLEPDMLDELIGMHKVLLISKTNCNNCLEAKEILEENGIDYALVELDKCPDFKPIGDVLVSNYGQKTVPALFVNGTLIRGTNHLKKLKESGGLEALLSQGTVAED